MNSLGTGTNSDGLGKKYFLYIYMLCTGMAQLSVTLPARELPGVLDFHIHGLPS